MKVDYSLLLLGEFYDNHTARFVRNLKRVNPGISIDFFTPNIRWKSIPTDYIEYFRECNIVDFSRVFHYVPFLNEKERIFNWKKHFRGFIKNRHYDIVNIHYPQSVYSYVLPEIKEVSDNLVLTPWGSDVLRANKRERKLLMTLYNSADFVTGHGDRFTDEFMNLFNIPRNKYVHADLGAETIDYIAEHKTELNGAEAKQLLGIEGCYAITCGYNASSAQCHSVMIKAIGHIKDKLPSNLVLLFPVTYPKNEKYISHLQSIVNEYGLNALWFDKYVDLGTLFLLRQATDMFIHIQTTDANNASLKEYLLLGKNCINGSWLKYPDVEEDARCPYHLVDDVSSLESVILKAYSEGPLSLSDKAIRVIESLGCKPAAKGWNDFFMSICK